MHTVTETNRIPQTYIKRWDQRTCGVGWYMWRPGGGVGGEEQVA